MCGRLNISEKGGLLWLIEQIGFDLPDEHFTVNYNVAPSSPLWGACIWERSISLQPMAWGFVPPWAKEGQFDKPLFNARSETIWEKASFKQLIRRYRGVVFANGFYEWKRSGKDRVPYYISLKNAPAMALAAVIQEHGDGYMQCALITTAANRDMEPIHHRQPVIIAPAAMAEWIENDKAKSVNRLMRPLMPGEFEIKEVGSFVNNARNNGPECLSAPVKDTKGQITFGF